MARKKHIINVHTSTGTTAPTGASLYLGEIAVQHTANEPALWIKVGATEASTDYEKFIGETEITNIFNQSKILGSGYTYSGLSYVTSATSIADAYSALTKVVIDDEKVVAESINDLNNRMQALEAVSGASEGLDALSASVVTNKTNVTNLSGSVVTNETDIQILSGMIEECKILGPEYTSSAISYVNSATTIAAAYSALTNEILLDEEAISAAFNDLNDRITPIEGLSGVTLDLAALSASVVENKTSITSLSASVVENKTDISEIDRITSEAINDLNSRLLPLEGMSGASDDISALSAAVVFNYNYIDEVEYVAGQSLNDLNDKIGELCGNSATKIFVETTQPGTGMLPNIYYDFGTITASTVFTLNTTDVENGVVNHYFFSFDTDSTVPNITWPSGLSWYGGSAPTLVANKHYEVSILNNIAIAMGV